MWWIVNVFLLFSSSWLYFCWRAQKYMFGGGACWRQNGRWQGGQSVVPHNNGRQQGGQPRNNARTKYFSRLYPRVMLRAQACCWRIGPRNCDTRLPDREAAKTHLCQQSVLFFASWVGELSWQNQVPTREQALFRIPIMLCWTKSYFCDLPIKSPIHFWSSSIAF